MFRESGNWTALFVFADTQSNSITLNLHSFTLAQNSRWWIRSQSIQSSDEQNIAFLSSLVGVKKTSATRLFAQDLPGVRFDQVLVRCCYSLCWSASTKAGRCDWNVRSTRFKMRKILHSHVCSTNTLDMRSPVVLFEVLSFTLCNLP